MPLEITKFQSSWHARISRGEQGHRTLCVKLKINKKPLIACVIPALYYVPGLQYAHLLIHSFTPMFIINNEHDRQDFCSNRFYRLVWEVMGEYRQTLNKCLQVLLVLQRSEVKWKLLSCIWLFTTLWTMQSMEFSRPEYWSGCPFPSPGDVPNPGIERRSPALQADSLPAEPPGKALTEKKVVLFISYS